MSIESASQQHSVERRPVPPTAMRHHLQLAYGRNTFGEGQRSNVRGPCFTTGRTAQRHRRGRRGREFGALGAHGRTTSETGYPLDRTQHDLAGGLVAQKAALTRTRLRYGGQMTLDIRIFFPKVSTWAGFGVR
jgi:hypothetical protein